MEHYCSDRELMLWYSGRDICHYEASVPKVTIKCTGGQKSVIYKMLFIDSPSKSINTTTK